MKKVINFNNILLILAILFAGLNFAGCEKEKNTIEDRQVPKTLVAMTEEELSSYITDIANTTGIDLHRISDLQCMDKLSQYNVKLIKHCVNNANAKGVMTEEKISILTNLAQAIKTAYSEGRLSDALELYNEFCSVCSSIDGFIINSNDFDLQTISFDESHIPISVPYNYLNNERQQAENFFVEIEESVPGFWNLQEETRINIVAVALYLRSQDNNKYFSYEDCELEARRMLALDLALATAFYEAALLSCAATGPAALGCIAVASATYGVSVGVSYYQYERAVENCRKQQ